MPSQPRSNIRACVQWRRADVFAGEEIECVITFKNIATVPTYEARSNGSINVHSGPQREARYAPSIAQTLASSSRPTHTRSPSTSSTQHAPPARGHRPTLSLNLVRSNSARGGSSTPLSARTPTLAPVRAHGRSLSIISLGKESAGERRSPTTLAASRKTAADGHSRSSSLQVLPRSALQSTQSMGSLPTRRQSPLFEATSAPEVPESVEQHSVRPIRRKPGTLSAGNTPMLAQQQFFRSPDADREPIPAFEFPPRQPSLPAGLSAQKAMAKPARNISSMHSSQPARPLSPRLSDTYPANPLNRVMSESSASGTPRSSSDFYSLSNHSGETLTSEAPQQPPSSDAPPPSARPTRRRPQTLGPARPETLMLGYARTTGSFKLDSSLVNESPFEDVKRKTVQGGGGVVGVEKPKRSSGLFGWGNISESISGLLGGNEMSTIAQMKADAGNKSIPLLSTPQSLLFVDITLAPGESKSYVYHFPLPRGLPPSHKGRAIKIEYALSIGVQRPDGQAVKYVEVPFRVLGSVSSRGIPLGHDLMSPYVLLQDSARTRHITTEVTAHSLSSVFSQQSETRTAPEPQKSMESFLRYTERLLHSTDVLPSPTSVLSRKSSVVEHEAASAKDAIDTALMNANIVSQDQESNEAQSANRFNINRSGQPVAVLTLLRPAYRLGESVVGIIDFSTPSIAAGGPAPVQSYAVYMELQSSEQVDSLLAVRSAASIQRATRKTYASVRESTLFARRIGFSLPIPATATPSFETSGVSLAWSMKIEFTTFRQLKGPGGDDQVNEDLLEELNRDERGITLIAREKLVADSFEITLPIRVFGAYSVDSAEKQPELIDV